MRQGNGKGKIKPRQLPPGRLSVDIGFDFAAAGITLQEDAAVARHIEQHDAAWSAGQRSLMAGIVHGSQGAGISFVGQDKPDFPAIGGPSQALGADPRVRKRLAISGEVNNCDRAAVVTQHGMVNEGDAIALRRNPQISNPSGSFLQDLADGKFQLSEPALSASHRKIRTITQPVCPAHPFEHLPRERHLPGASWRESLAVGRRRSGCEGTTPSRPSRKSPRAEFRSGPTMRTRGCRGAWNKFPPASRPMLRYKKWSGRRAQSEPHRSCPSGG